MAMVKAKQLAKLIKQLEKELKRPVTMEDFRKALNGQSLSKPK